MSILDTLNIGLMILFMFWAFYGTFLIRKALRDIKGEPGEPGCAGPMGIMGEPARLLNIISVLTSERELNEQTDVQHLDTFIIQGEYWVYIDRSHMTPEHKAPSYQDGAFHFCGFVDGSNFYKKEASLTFVPNFSSSEG